MGFDFLRIDCGVGAGEEGICAAVLERVFDRGRGEADEVGASETMVFVVLCVVLCVIRGNRKRFQP